MAKPDWGELQQRFLSEHAATGVSPKEWCEAQGLNYATARRYIKKTSAQKYAPGEIDGTVIVNGDVQIVFTSEQEIKIGDVVDIDGTAYRIVNPNPAKPASLVLCYKAQLRA